MAYRRKTTYRRKSYYGRLAKAPSRMQRAFSSCRRRGLAPAYCYKKALRTQRNYFPSPLQLPNGNRVVEYLPKPGFFKAILQANSRVIRYVKDTPENRAIYGAGQLWANIDFNANAFALYNAQGTTPMATQTPVTGM